MENLITKTILLVKNIKNVTSQQIGDVCVRNAKIHKEDTNDYVNPSDLHLMVTIKMNDMILS